MGGVSVNARVDARGDLFRRQAAVKKALKAKVGALESPWDFSALHAELDVICPLADNDDVLWCVLVVVTGVGAVGVGVES